MILTDLLNVPSWTSFTRIIWEAYYKCRFLYSSQIFRIRTPEMTQETPLNKTIILLPQVDLKSIKV